MNKFNKIFEGYVGICVGETNSYISVWKEGSEIRLVHDEFGNIAIPSFVSFTGGKNKFVVGEKAKKKRFSNPNYTIYSFTRYIGRKFSHEQVQKDADNVEIPFKIVEEEGKPLIFCDLGQEKIKPSDIFTRFILRLKSIAEEFLKMSIEKCLLSVPLSFSDYQRQSFYDSAVCTGLHVRRKLVNESFACVYAYKLHERKIENVAERNILVIDIGGRRTTISMISVEEGIFESKVNMDDENFGGNTITEHFFEFVAQEFEKVFQVDPRKNYLTKLILLDACERAKIELSQQTGTTLLLKNICDGKDFIYQISRENFEKFIPLREIMEKVRKAVNDSGVDQIHDIVLAGGTCHITRIQEEIRDYFEGKKIHNSIPPCEVISYGVSVFASILHKKPKIPAMTLDLIPLSLGIETANDLRTVFVFRNTTVSYQENVTKVGILKVSDFGTSLYDSDRQVLKIRVLEGERKLASNNREIAMLELEEVKKDSQIRITFNINFDLEVSVKVEDMFRFCSGGNHNEVGITVKTKERLTIDEVEEMGQESDERGTWKIIPPSNNIEDKQNRVLEREMLEQSLIRSLNMIKIVGLEKVGEPEKLKYEKIVKDMMLMLDHQKEQTTTKEFYIEKRKELEEVVVKYYREVLGDEFDKYFYESQVHPNKKSGSIF